MKLLVDRVAVVTGGARGIGFATAAAFAANGAAVVVADLDGEAAEHAQRQLEAAGGRAAAVTADVADPGQMMRLVEASQRTFGSVDVFVNNAGITRDATLRAMTLTQWQAVIDVDLTGTVLGVKAAAAVMREQRRGTIVNISSISGRSDLSGRRTTAPRKRGSSR